MQMESDRNQRSFDPDNSNDVFIKGKQNPFSVPLSVEKKRSSDREPTNLKEKVNKEMHKQATDSGKKGELSNRMTNLEARRGVIEEVDESLGESEVSRLSEFQYYMNDEYVENLKDYNSRRRKMLPAWQVPIPEEVVPNE